MTAQTIQFTGNPAIASRAERYVTLRLDMAQVLDNWRQSLMAHEWLTPDGRPRAIDDLNMLDRDKILKARKAMMSGEALARPVLGIGILDNIEIGTGREIVCLLALEGARAFEAHVPLSNREDFEGFLAS